ncbi:KilA-N domain-containing protein [Pseudomonas palmensis]|uniref:KilA-N domain-containing protein n=1 Tax=Pseudomonas palmensis TaxID=2815362 RepID=UPI001AE8FFD9|nr:KilA-N domain-containing protein [Pseudomonas palmensis]
MIESNVIPFHYQGQAVRFNSEGWINATDVAKRYGKKPAEWLRLPESVKYMDALARHLNVGESHLLVRSAKGRSGGTWLNPKLAVSFARWLDVDFAVWCDLHIDALLRGELDEKQKFDRACKALQDQNERGSFAGRELVKHRWNKPPLEAEVEHWRSQLQMTLGLDAA